MTAIWVGTTNPAKLAAVRAVTEALDGYGEVSGVAVTSAVAEQPIGLAEIFAGAEHRAREAWARAEVGDRLGVGLEDGLYENPVRAGAYLNVCAACVFDGARAGFGTSSGFPVPDAVVRRILGEGLDLGQALAAEGLTDDSAVGAGLGAIGVLSRGRLVRAQYTQPAVLTALLPWIGGA